MLWTDDDGKLDFDPALNDVVRDARVVLNRDVRHSILKITPGGDDGESPSDAAQA
jgi:glycerol-3-phosphate O-acyltransferase